MKDMRIRTNGSRNASRLFTAGILMAVLGLFFVLPLDSCRRAGRALVRPSRGGTPGGEQAGEGPVGEGREGGVRGVREGERPAGEGGGGEEYAAKDRLSGGGFELSARFPAEPEEISDLFHCFLPDSGVVPVLAKLKNNDSVTLYIHSDNGIPELPAGFRGFSLIVDGEHFQSVHPVEVVKRIRGKTGPIKYRKPGYYDLVSGTMLPPVGGYHIYKEVDIGRFYKPLLRHSLYPALIWGMLEPIRLDPGEEAEGYLFFLAPQELGPYAAAGDSLRKVCEGRAVELSAIACRSDARYDTLFLYGGRFPHVDGPAGVFGGEGYNRGGGDASDSVLIFALKDTGGRWRSRKLVVGEVKDMPVNVEEEFLEIATVSSKKGEIVDAAVKGRYAACAMNFKVKSKVYLMDMEEPGPVLIGESRFERNVRRIFLTDAGLFVITTDGLCRLFSLSGMKRLRETRLGRDIVDAVLTEDCLAVIRDEEGLAFFGVEEDNLLEKIGKQAMPELRRDLFMFDVGVSDYYPLVHRGEGTAGDTLKILAYSGGREFEEIGRMALPGRVTAAAARGLDILVQLGDGTLLRLGKRSGMPVNGVGRSVDFGIVEAAFLPSRVRDLRWRQRDFVAIGENGIFASGSPSDFTPCGPGGMLKKRVRVGMPPARETVD